MQQYYYHLAPLPLQAGAVIKQGNWGRILKLYCVAESDIFREYVLENIRKTHFRLKPSRLESVFVFKNEHSVKIFLTANPHRKTDILYKVRFVEEAPLVHEAPWTMCEIPSGTTCFQWAESMAQKYWEYSGPEKITVHDVTSTIDAPTEVISTSPIEIIEEISDTTS